MAKKKKKKSPDLFLSVISEIPPNKPKIYVMTFV